MASPSINGTICDLGKKMKQSTLSLFLQVPWSDTELEYGVGEPLYVKRETLPTSNIQWQANAGYDILLLCINEDSYLIV
jgi:hypothetical protein